MLGKMLNWVEDNKVLAFAVTAGAVLLWWYLR